MGIEKPVDDVAEDLGGSAGILVDIVQGLTMDR